MVNKNESDYEYPYHVSNKIFIKRKSVTNLRNEDMADSNWYIGSSLKGSDSLRGISFEEEKLYLKDIIGVSPTSEKWTETTKQYWANIRVMIPNGIGKELEVGFKFKTEEEALAYDADPKSMANVVKGFPINTSDYILYRYCLVYKKVAATVNDVNKSIHILFYLYSRAAEITDDKKKLDSRNKATLRRFEVMGDADLKDAVLLLFDENVDSMTADEKDIALEKYEKAELVKFLQVTADPLLKTKAFIQKCITKQLLRKFENTDTVVYGESTVLGSDLNEAAITLESASKSQVLATLKARMQMFRPTIKIDEPKVVIPEPVIPKEGEPALAGVGANNNGFNFKD